jgi:hypothetical protein
VRLRFESEEEEVQCSEEEESYEKILGTIFVKFNFVGR